MVFRRGGDSEDKAAVAAGGDIEAREVVVFVNSRKTDDRYWKRQRTTYCTERADEPILPPPPAGYVWADALSGWVARRNVGQCLTSPNGGPEGDAATQHGQRHRRGARHLGGGRRRRAGVQARPNSCIELVRSAIYMNA